MTIKQVTICACTLGLSLFAVAMFTASAARAETCGDFRLFLEKFETDKAYQLDHTKWPLHIANISLCDEQGNPRIHPESGQPYPRDWCGQDLKRERFKNGVFMLRSLRKKSQISQTVNAGEEHANILLACDPANKNVCGNYWGKYYFSRNDQGCWQLERWEQKTE